MKLTGAQILMESLIEQGVDVVFGYPGGTVINIYDALNEYQHKIRHVLTSHEQGATHAADGYARSSGKTGVVIATSGPGATNLVTGIATAYMDSIPLIAITANVPCGLIGRDSFQEVDIAGITLPVTKHNYIVKDLEQLADTVRQAFLIANSGRPGPVLIDIPKDVTAQKTEFFPKPIQEPKRAQTPTPNSIDAAIQMINESKRPLIFAGGGILASHAEKELMSLADRMNAPVSLSLMGLAALPSSYPRNLGMIGMHGTPVSSKAVAECDLLLAVGTRFSDRVSGDRTKFAPLAKIIHIDIDPSEHGKNIRVDLPIIADAKSALSMLTKNLAQKHNDAWIHELLQYRVQNTLPFSEEGPFTDTRDIVRALSEIAGEDAIIVTDVGQHQIITAQYYRFSKPRSFITSGGLGTMGFGMGAAVGAKIANPDRPVILITGDGCFHMNMNELACAVSEKLAITVIIINNGVLGMVRQWQKLFYDKRYSAVQLNRSTNFVKLAEAMGAQGLSITKKEEIRPMLEKALSWNLPCIIDCAVDKEDNVFPMIPPNGSRDDIIFCE